MPTRLAEALRETIRVQDGRVPLLERHLARLRGGGCDADVRARVRAEAERAALAWAEPYGRMTLLVAIDGTVSAEVTSAPSMISIAGGPTVALVPSAEPHLPPGAAKPADRSFWDAALSLARVQGAHVAVLVSADERVLDTSQATIWAVRGTRLLTPPSPPALAGVSRGFVFDIAPSLGLAAESTELSPHDLDAADELVL
ncbi:MAG: aminotransferase class IV, partial [Coriobacteriia bacterium]|nr:aminotransferase class IV [Coriobacteriia bacterium]